MGLFCFLWFGDFDLSVTLVITMTVNGLVAVLTGVLAPIVFAKLKRDPALGTDEITTALSDNVSMLIYLIVATLFLF
jgi:magnesium transporter